MQPAKPRLILLVMGCAIGISLNFVAVFSATFATFVKPIAAEFQWSRTQVVGGYSVASAMLAFTSWPMGYLLDHVSPRRVALIGVPIFGAALATLALTPPSYAAYLAICALVGVAGAGCFHMVYVTLLSSWFDRRFGFALGAVVGGSGLGAALLPSYCQALISAFDWRTAYALLGLTTVIIAWPNAWLLRDKRPETGNAQSETLAGTAMPVAASSWTRGAALRSIILWRLVLCYFLIGAMVGAHIINIVPLLTDRGVDGGRAAALAGLFGVSILLARLGCGYLLDRLDAGRLGSIVFFLGWCGAWLLILPSENMIVTAAAILLIGIASGAEGDVAVFVARRLFGTAIFGTLNGVIYSVLLAGVLIGPLAFSFAHDRYGSYLPAQYLVLAAGAVAILLHWGVTRPASHELLRKLPMSGSKLPTDRSFQNI